MNIIRMVKQGDMNSLKHNFIGHWSSETSGVDTIIFDYENYEWGNEKGKWAIDGDEIWLIRKNSEHGIKWVFKFVENNILYFCNPEDFLYQGGGNYIYYQMTSATLNIKFSRI